LGQFLGEGPGLGTWGNPKMGKIRQGFTITVFLKVHKNGSGAQTVTFSEKAEK
jgi:hypothetical protein